MIKEHPFLLGSLILIALLIACLFDVLIWKLKPESKILEMIDSTDPKKLMVGLTQLRKRNKDISTYIDRALPFLISDSVFDRVTAKMILKKHFQEDYALIEKYSGTDSLEKCKENLLELNCKYDFYS